MKNETATNKSPESSQGDGSSAPPAPSSPPPLPELPPDNQTSRGGNTVLKSGPLFISSKGIGWTSWKKRWFILTKTSLVFFRSDPSAIPQKGSEANFTLGGIDLNNSGSVIVKAEKKLLTILFPDGRAFTLKAETLEDLHEWKTSLEEALAQAPNATLVMGQNGIFKNEQADGADGSSEQLKDKQPAKSLVIGRPILLALEDVDGSPSFLEKALRFIEDHGVMVEGILRQAADVDDVMHRIQEYEQGKSEFSAREDAHVIADCVKYFLRELPSPPVPASCCNALLEACRSDVSNRVNAMRVAICETFPEPNRRLLQRILLMMQAIASHKTVNRMSTSAVAACMAPLLLRPLLGGECEIATDFDVGGDGSMQLLQAAAAANHAQAIVITLLEEYQTIFSEGTMSPGLYSDSEEDESEDEEVTDDDEYYEDDEQDDGTQESDAYTEDDPENASNGSYSESGGSGKYDLSDDKGSDNCSLSTKSLEELDFEVKDRSSSGLIKPTLPLHDDTEISTSVPDQSSHSLEPQRNEVDEVSGDESPEITVGHKPTGSIQKSKTIANDPGRNSKRRTVLGRASAKKNLSMESIDFPVEEELEIQKLEILKIDLHNKISEEVKGNTFMQANLEQRKRALHERRLALQKDVARLQDQLQKEREKRAILEAGLNASKGRLPSSVMIDVKLKAELEEITQAEADVSNLAKKFDELSEQISQQHEQKLISMNDSSEKLIHTSNPQEITKNRQKDTEDCAVPPLLGKSTSKDTPREGAESRDDKKPESKSGKRGHEKQQQYSTRYSNSMSTASSNSKRSGTRTERGQQGTNSSLSPLTKLTNRLNFLKEKRSQIANELQCLDKGRNPGQGLTSPDTDRGSDLPHLLQNLEKGQGPEVPSSSNVEKSRGSEHPRSYENAEKGLQVEGQSSKDFEQNTEVDSQLLPNNGGKQPQSQHLQIPDRENLKVMYLPIRTKTMLEDQAANQ